MINCMLIFLYCYIFTLNLEINLETTKMVHFNHTLNLFFINSLLFMKASLIDTNTASDVSIKCFSP